MTAKPPRSPLWMVTQEPGITALIRYLTDMKAPLMAGEGGTLCFSERELKGIRESFSLVTRKGEARLHRLCDLFAHTLFTGSFEMASVVIGELPTRDGRFTLIQALDRSTLYGETDLALGNRLLARMRLQDDQRWTEPSLVANFVEYQPHAINPYGVHKMTSRIKAEEEVWNKVCDEIFEIDELVGRDKDLQDLSRFIKDVFGIKLVVGDSTFIRPLEENITHLRWAPEDLARVGVAREEATDRLRILEVKDYLEGYQQKKSGWEAIKLVAGWGEQAFEIQIQSMNNYLLEREYLTHESHSGFKQRRDQLRDSIATKIPLFGYYRDLLQWLFCSHSIEAPSYEGIRIELRS